MANKGVKPKVSRQVIADFAHGKLYTFEHFKLMGYKKPQVYVAMKRVDARQLVERKKGQVGPDDVFRLFRSIKAIIQIKVNEGSYAIFR